MSALIRAAYGPFLPDGVAGLSGWINSAHYAITAKSATPVSMREKYAMLQPVLEERFKLKWHREVRQLPV